MANKCILLVRVSSERQTLDAQREELIAYASRHGYAREDMELIEDKESAIRLTEEERNGLNRLKECIETGMYDCVFAWEPSRIARKRKVLYSITDYLIERQIQLHILNPEIHLLDEKTKRPSDAANLAFALYAELAEAEMRNKKERFARAKNAAFEQGKYMGGKHTTGYTVDENGFWAIDEKGAELIRLMFYLYNTGNYSMTELGKELKSRGYFPNLALTHVKNEILSMLRNPIYVGQRTSKNIYPAIIDQKTWDLCVQRRSANKHRPKKQNVYLLTPLIRCECGASYSVNLHDGTYTCRIRHNAVEKGLKHSPSIHAGLIESLAWYVALQELSADIATGKSEAKEQFTKDIQILKQKLSYSRSQIQVLEGRRKDLDQKFFVDGGMSKEQYNNLTQKQDSKIKEEQANARAYEREIKTIETKIAEAKTFDSMLNDLTTQYDSIKDGTDQQTMRSIIHRYITEIRIYPIEGKKTSWWKKICIHTTHDDAIKSKVEALVKQGFEDVADTFRNEFTVDCYHHIAYFDNNATSIVPFIFMNRLPKIRIDRRIGRIRKPTIQHQY